MKIPQRLQYRKSCFGSDPNQEVPLPGKVRKATSALWSPQPGDHRHSWLENKGPGRAELQVDKVSDTAQSVHIANKTEHSSTVQLSWGSCMTHVGEVSTL